MAHDIVIRGGEIVDGTGAEATPGDVAIDDGRISAVGKVDGKGRQEIDAAGNVVSPGFVDLHTHLDAQIGWDPQMDAGELARRHHRADGQLRRHLRPLQAAGCRALGRHDGNR